MDISTAIRVVFVQKDPAPDRLVCEAEIIFENPGPLAGLKLVGFSLWRGPDGVVYVTGPSRAFGAGKERRYHDYVRSVDGRGEPIKRLKSWVLAEYERSLCSSGELDKQARDAAESDEKLSDFV